MAKRDHSLDYLLDLHSQILVVDEKGGHWVKFVVKRVPVTDERPHGLDYSLTIHGADNERLGGFDNAHPVKGAKSKGNDHKHRFKTVKPYEYKNAGKLMEDFWDLVDSILKERGVL